MKLRNKILIAITLAWLVFLALTYIGSRVFLIQGFLELENDKANNDLSRVDQALDQINYALYTFTSDWSHWNDLYAYVKGENPEFVPNNLNMTALVNSNINLMTFWSKEGKLLVGSAADTDNKKLIPFPPGLEKYLYPGSKALDRSDVNNDVRGYILTSKGIMLIAASAITDGDKLLPPLGAAIFGRNLNQDLVNQLSGNTKVDLKLYLPKEINQSEQLKEHFKTISTNDSSHFSTPVSDNQLEGYTVIRDINDEPIGMLKMTTPRDVYSTGAKAVGYYLVGFLLLGIVFVLLMLWLLRALIIKRLETLDKEVAYIGASGALDKRVNESGNDELSFVSKEINQMLDTIQASHDQLEHRVEKRTEELKTTNIQLQQEITERKSVERELIIHKEHLVRLAHYDSLTSLPNRVFFNEILSKAIKHADKNNKMFGILFLDLDRFKNINDALGHHIGDLVLKEMGQRFSTILRTGDILARLGGDEFIILLNDISSPEFAGTIASRLLEVCGQAMKIESHEFFLSASIGICICPNDGNSIEDLHKYADMAMYKAKRAGGGNYQYYTEEMNISASEHVKMEAELRKAIKNEEFILHYQPQINVRTGKLERVEALIRWEHPTIGMIPPDKFIPLAEETGLINPIGEWALIKACTTCKKWQDEGYDPVKVAVNISPKQFRHQDICGAISEALKISKLSSKYLEVEITETAVMDDLESTIHKLKDIRKMGVHISIDDFGTGYTSISYLKQFPINILKIDQHFVKGIPDSKDDIAIITAVIALGHNLGFEIVAEGVETQEQMEFLVEHNCDLIQGYLLSRPVPENKIILQFSKDGKTIDKITQ